jgi:hypothetical protein
MVLEVFDFLLFVQLGVIHYNSTSLHVEYEHLLLHLGGPP